MWAWEFLLALKTAGHERTSQKRMQNKTSKKVLIGSSLTGIFNHFLNMSCLSESENIYVIYFTAIWEKNPLNS